MDQLDEFIARVKDGEHFIYTVNIRTGALEVWTCDEYLRKPAFKANLVPHIVPNAAGQQAHNIRQRRKNRS